MTTTKIDLATQATGTLNAAQMPALTGDVTSSAGSVATTLATVNSDVGSYTSANITVNAKGLITAAANGSGGGGVTSVALTVPSWQTVSGSPVTSSGTLAITDNTQTANEVFAGPSSGSAAAPTFRALVAADLPSGTGTVTSVGLTVPVEFNISGSPVTGSGTLAITKANENANLVYAGPSSGSAAAPTFRALVAADLPGGSGTVTSVGLTVPSWQTVSGSPVTGSGTLAITDNTQSANQVFAGPSSGSAAAPTFRSLAAADLPASAVAGVLGTTMTGSPPATGAPAYVQVPYNCTITGWSIIADQSGSASIDVWFLAGSAPPTAPSIPTSTNKISASAPIVLSSAQSAAGGSSAISTWTTSLTEWGELAFNLTSVSTVTRITIQIWVTKN